MTIQLRHDLLKFCSIPMHNNYVKMVWPTRESFGVPCQTLDWLFRWIIGSHKNWFSSKPKITYLNNFSQETINFFLLSENYIYLTFWLVSELFLTFYNILLLLPIRQSIFILKLRLQSSAFQAFIFNKWFIWSQMHITTKLIMTDMLEIRKFVGNFVRNKN